MPLNDSTLRGTARWTSAVAKGVTIEDTATVTLTPESLLPSLVFRNGCVVAAMRDFVAIGPVGSRDSWLVVTFRPETKWATGCFDGSTGEFVADVEFKPVGNVHRREYEAVIALVAVFAETRGQPAPRYDSGSSEAGLSAADCGELIATG